MATETDAGPFDTGFRKIPSPTASPAKLTDEKEVFDFLGLENVEKFIERKLKLPIVDPFEYSRDGNDPGLVLIFNQENFPTERERKGSRRDVNELVICLQRLGFNIEKDNIMHNSTTEQIKTKLANVATSDLSEYNSLIIFFLTHGRRDDDLLTADSSISTYFIWKNFTQCIGLENKPKMFVFQACKGGEFSATHKTSISEEPKQFVQHPTFMGPDMLVVYSTIEGNVSFRSILTGSWFIQELCKNFNAYGKRDDVLSLITRTAKCVSGNYFHNEQGVNKKQMPVYMSTLSKKFYLNRNKDRAMVLMYRSYYEDILSEVQKIKENVKTLTSKV